MREPSTPNVSSSPAISSIAPARATVSAPSPSTKEQIVRCAERLFAERGLEGVSLREIGAAAGNGNNSAVQYHFGSKAGLVQAIVEFRTTHLYERRRSLITELAPTDVRGWLACYMGPLLEQGEADGSHYLSFIAMLYQHDYAAPFAALPRPYKNLTESFRREISRRIDHVPEPLRDHRIAQAILVGVQATADRERARAARRRLLPFAPHAADLLDSLVGFLEAPVSPDALAALSAPRSAARRSHPAHRPLLGV